jgi:hypothetical protein
VIVLVAVVVMLAGLAMLMVMVLMMVLVRLIVGMGMIMSMRMIVMAVFVGMAMMVVSVVMVVITHVGAALRLEGALHGRGRAALPPRQLGKGRIVFDVEGIARDLHKAMLAAQVPSEPHEAMRVLGPHLKKLLRRGLHLHQAAVLQPQGIAVVDGGLHVEIEQDLGSTLAFQRPMAAVPCAMIEGHRVDDTVGLHGRLADDGGDAGHGFVSS